jgi:putative ABC transport system ATP-binding protein
MAVMDNTKILLLDEPTAALDPKAAYVVMELARKITQEEKLTALMVTHRMKDALQYGNRLIMMKEGAIESDYNESQKIHLKSEDLISWFNN